MNNDAVEINMKGLDQLLKALKNPPTGRLGVLGGKTQRKESGQTNAEIGKKHEFGEDGMPIRSFLRVPLMDRMQKALDKAGAFTKEVLDAVIQIGNIRPWLQKVLIVGEGIVAEGFDTGGFGKWPPSDMTYKKNHQTLVETQQIRNSITSDIQG